MRISNLNKEKTMEKMIDEELKDITGGTIIPVIVKQGDTLEKFAKKFKCTVEDICEWNDIKDPNMIYVGQKLIFKF